WPPKIRSQAFAGQRARAYGRGDADERHPPGETPTTAGGPGGLGRVHRALRPEDLWLVPAVEPSGSRRGRRDADGLAETGQQNADVCLRPEPEFPCLAEDRYASRLERFLGQPR